MPRKLRVELPDARYHIMSRGDRREDIFLNDVDRHDFIKTLAETCQKTGWQVHAYCLRRNHVHLVKQNGIERSLRTIIPAKFSRLSPSSFPAGRVILQPGDVLIKRH